MDKPKYGIIEGMEKVATDIYTFSELRNGGFTYADKTDALYAMAVGEAGKQFFNDRPLRCLNWRTPRAAFAGLILRHVRDAA